MSTAYVEIRTGRRGTKREPCAGKHPDRKDVADRPLPLQPCEGGFLFIGIPDGYPHCSACHAAAGEDVGGFTPFAHRAWETAIAPEVLDGWYERQVAWTEAEALRLADRLAANYDQLRVKEKRGLRDPIWPKLFMLEAQYAWLTGCRFLSEGPKPPELATLQLLAERRHVVACQVHGVPTVSEEEMQAAFGVKESLQELAGGLTRRGYLTGESRMAWFWYCTSCAPLEALRDRYLADWLKFERARI